MENIRRERVLHGLDEVIDSRPLRTYDSKGNEITVDLSKYRKIGNDKDYDWYTLIETK